MKKRTDTAMFIVVQSFLNILSGFSESRWQIGGKLPISTYKNLYKSLFYAA